MSASSTADSVAPEGRFETASTANDAPTATPQPNTVAVSTDRAPQSQGIRLRRLLFSTVFITSTPLLSP